MSETPEGREHETFDYVIVGGGAAGSVLAARLAEDGTASVVLLEAGPPDENEPRILELDRWPELLESEYDYAYAVEPQERTSNKMVLNRGRVLGGSGSINACVAWRMPDRDLLQWVREGAGPGWGPDEMRPHFDRVLERTGFSATEGGSDLARAFIAAGVQAGYQERDWRTDCAGEGIGFASFLVQGNRRRSSAVSYLHPLASLPDNVTVATGRRVFRVSFDDQRRAIGVETDDGPVRARREVVVCCGAFDSPKLLLLSGVGPAEDLRQLGLPVVADLPVGRHLLDHVEVAGTSFESTRPVPDDQLPVSGVDAVLMARVTDEQPARPEAAVWLYAGADQEAMLGRLGQDKDTTGFAFGHHVLYTLSEGTVTLRSPDPDDPPRIDPRYFTDPLGYDERVAVEALRLTRRLALQPALQPWIRRTLEPDAAVISDQELSEYARSRAHTDYHPAGTCKMGADGDSGAVVDPQLRVRGVHGLRVADASVFPSMIGVNPVVTCMAIGEKCAELVRAAAIQDLSGTVTAR